MNESASRIRTTRPLSFGQMLEKSLSTDSQGEAFRFNGESLNRLNLFLQASTLADKLYAAGLQQGQLSSLIYLTD